MSRHDGVSCDSCMKGNFRGRRYKCLVCYDYDLCGTCYEAGASSTRHLTDHPMQCILTRSDFELYYGGEGVSIEQPQSLTCPYCTRMGFTETTLQEHVAADHPDTSFEVICPICAYLPGGEPNLVTDDISGHLTLEHRSGPRDLITFLDDSTSSRHNVRRITHPSRGVNASRPRRSNMHFSSSGGLSPSSRDGIDPITELLTQLSGVRRTGASSSGSGNSAQNTGPSQLQQLQMQLQIERQQVRAARQQLERMPKRPTQAIGSIGGTSTSANQSNTMTSIVSNVTASNNNVASSTNPSNISSSTSYSTTLLLPRVVVNPPSDSWLQSIEKENANRSLFTRELVVSTLVDSLQNLPDVQQTRAQTPASSVSTAMSSPETPGAATTSSSANQQATSKISESASSSSASHENESTPECDSKKEQSNAAADTPNKHNSATTQPAPTNSLHQAAATTANQANQGLPANANAVTTQSATPVVQTLMHVLPQPLVLQQPLPIRNTGTGTIREQVATPPASTAYLRGGVGPVGVSTGTSRRKPVRTVDGRNQSTEPPPPH